MHENKKQLIVRPIIFGVLGGVSLLGIYFGILSWANSFTHAIEQFINLWYWISLLVVGFGIQMGLFTYIRGFSRIKAMTPGATSTMATAGGVSTGAMIACCAHHLTDVLPILGLSAAAVFLGKYQVAFMVMGVLSNLIGVNMMLKIMQQHKLYHASGFMNWIMNINMQKTLYINIIISVFIFLIVLVKIV